MELSKEQKANLVKNRLMDYQVRIFNQEMDLIACQAIDDKEGVEQVQKKLEQLKKAYEAVEGMI